MKLNEISENISHTSKRLRDIERKKGVKPGTPEWFKLWFSLPYLKESAEKVYNILDNVDCGPFDGGCVLVAQALQQIHGGDIVVLVNDKGIADHAAVKVGNNLVDFDGALPVKQFIKRFEDNEHTTIKSIRPIQNGDLPEAPRNKELVPQLVNALTESTLREGFKIQLERGKDMDVLHIVDTKTNKRTEVRGKPGYETSYDPTDSLHQLIDKIGKAANISELINGEVVTINPKHPDSGRATSATTAAFNEDAEVDLHGNAERGYVLSKISVPADQRGQGRGTEIMQQIVDRMDKEGAIIALTPDTVFGGAKSKLIDFYKRFGFVPNKGRNKDFRFRETMIRYPKQINEETGKEMLSMFQNMHHDTAMNKEMDQFILTHDWELRDFTPDMFPSEEEFFDYDDPFNRVIDIDYSHRVDISQPIIVGPQYSDGKYSVIDGNHRAARAQSMGKTIKGYFPIKKVSEAFDTDVEWVLDMNARNQQVYATKVDDAYIELTYKRLLYGDVYIEFTRGGRLGVTGEGNQNKIFGAVINHMKQWVAKNNPPKIMFSALKMFGDTSRSSLYKRMVQRFASQNGYDYDVEDTKNEDTFILTKKQQPTQTNEALDQPYPYRWVKKTDEYWQATAMTDSGANLEITFEYFSWDAEWELFFTLNGGFKATAAGDQFRIFATVVKAIDEWWKSTSSEGVPVKTIQFSADKLNDKTGKTGSREKLYNRFAQQFANSIGFIVQHNDAGNATDFELVNPNYSKRKVNEVLDQPYPVEWNLQADDEWFAWAKDEEIQIQIKTGGNRHWTIRFKVNETMDKTGAGDEFRTFATVKAAIQQWWAWASKNAEVDVITFSAEKIVDTSRSRLYNRFAQQFARTIGYDMEVVTGRASDIFYLKKPGLEENIANDNVNGKSNAGLGLTIFDIDDTLMHTTAQIKVVKDGRPVRSLTNQEFNTYELKPGEEFDFGEFRNAEKFRRESKPMPRMIAKLKAILANAGDSKVIMLTARADFDDKETFLSTFRDLGIDMSRVHVHRAGNTPGNPAQTKAIWIRKYLETGKYARVRLYDDAMSNIRMFNEIAKEYPDIKFYPYLVTHDGSTKTIREEVNINNKSSGGVSNNSSIIDNKNGWGAVPDNQEVDYLGLRVLMTPNHFIDLAAPLGAEPSDKIAQHLEQGGTIGSPFLQIEIPESWEDGDFTMPARVMNHEGRNRMAAVAKVLGNNPVETHLFFNKGLRNRHITDEFKKNLNRGLVKEKSKSIIRGPFFSLTESIKENDFNKVVTELLNTQAKDAKWTMSGEDMSKMEFTASNGVVYEIDFLAPYIGPDEIYPTDFVPDMPNEVVDQAVFVEFSQKNAAGAAKQGVAGTGAAAEVFGIVTNAILEFARNRKPSMLYFQAAEPNRQKLYAAIVNRLVKSMPGYDVKRLGDKFAVYSNNIGENFADGKNPGRKGLAKRSGVNTKASVSSLRKTAKNSSGEKQRMAHWLANMKAGRAKKK